VSESGVFHPSLDERARRARRAPISDEKSTSSDEKKPISNKKRPISNEENSTFDKTVATGRKVWLPMALRRRRRRRRRRQVRRRGWDLKEEMEDMVVWGRWWGGSCTRNHQETGTGGAVGGAGTWWQWN